MVKLIDTGYTDYPDGVCRPIKVLSYDGNLYCHVQFLADEPPVHEWRVGDDGHKYFVSHETDVVGDGVWEIKRGYVSRTPYTHENMDDYNNLRRIDWHVLQGKDRRSFKPRKAKTTWVLYRKHSTFAGRPRLFKSKAEAVRFALGQARVLNVAVEIGRDYTLRNNSGYQGRSGGISIEAMPNGDVCEFNNGRRHGGRGAKLQNMEGCIQLKYLRGYGKAKERPRARLQAWERR